MQDSTNTVTQAKQAREKVITSITVPGDLHFRTKMNALLAGSSFLALVVRGLELANEEVERKQLNPKTDL